MRVQSQCYFCARKIIRAPLPPGGDGTPLYKTYRNMPPNCADPNGRVFCRLSTSPLRERQRRAGTLAPESGNGLWKSLGFWGGFGLKTGMDCLFWSVLVKNGLGDEKLPDRSSFSCSICSILVHRYRKRLCLNEKLNRVSEIYFREKQC